MSVKPPKVMDVGVTIIVTTDRGNMVFDKKLEEYSDLDTMVDAMLGFLAEILGPPK